jgi:hypothetical protein
MFKLALGILFILNTAGLTLTSVAWCTDLEYRPNKSLLISSIALWLVNIIVDALLFIAVH